MLERRMIDIFDKAIGVSVQMGRAMILSKAREKIDRFNKLGVHYNVVVNHVYDERRSFPDLFDADYLPYLVAALISFEMERMMGQGAERKYDVTAGGFATILHRKLTVIKSKIEHLTKISLVDVDLEEERENIESAYRELSAGGLGGLNQRGDDFHVGATKILHFLNPELFLIVDSNAARAFRTSHGVTYQNTTQPGYSSAKYMKCMELAKADIKSFGVKEFCALEPGIPIARIYDKLTFATGSGWF